MAGRSVLGILMCVSYALLLSAGNRTAAHAETDEPTPVLLSVPDPPNPFLGSDGRRHLVYELEMVNFSSGDTSIEKVEVLSGDSVLETYDATEIATRLHLAGQREPTATLPHSGQGMLFVHVALPGGAAIPQQLTHRVTVKLTAPAMGRNHFVISAGKVEVDRRPVSVVGPPLEGMGYLAADSCCESVRHMRAALPINGRVWIAQRFAVDWEQLNAEGRIYSGPREKVESYAIFGKPVLAVADAVVDSTLDGLPEQTPGKFPEGISLQEADGNSVVLKLPDGRYAFYAHMQPGSLRVHKGDKVKRGQVLGLVGNTGNSLVPHLHFHVMDGPSPLASNGCPYEIDGFVATAQGPETKVFDEVEADGSVLPVAPIHSPREVKSAMPLDQLVVSFPKK